MNPIHCPHCHVAVPADPRFAGQVVPCPQCGQPFQLPAGPPPPMMPYPAPAAYPGMGPPDAAPAEEAKPAARRKPAGPDTLMIQIGVGAGILFLVGLVMLVVWMSGGSKKPPAPTPQPAEHKAPVKPPAKKKTKPAEMEKD